MQELTAADGFTGMFWLYLNKGRFFSTPMKTFLTLLNIFMIVIAAVIVSSLHNRYLASLTWIYYSAD
jgi:hypothetical protein